MNDDPDDIPEELEPGETTEEKPEAPEVKQDARKNFSDFNLEDVAMTLGNLIESCKMWDGSVPAETMMLIRRADIENLWAAKRAVEIYAHTQRGGDFTPRKKGK